MENILKKANVKPDPAIITAATDAKTMSGKRIEHFFWAAVLFAFGSVFGLIGLQSIGTVLFDSPGWVADIFLVLTSLGCFGAAWFFIGMSYYAVKGESNWFVILYPDHFHYQYRKQTKDKKLTKLDIPITAIQKCHILRKRVRRLTYVKSKRIVIVEYHLSVHLEYASDEGTGYINLTQLDGFQEANQILSYLQNEKQIPVFLSIVEPEGYENLKEEKALELAEPEKVDFLGDLKVYDKKEHFGR